MSTPYLGEIRAVGFNFPPQGWATCNGQLLDINEYNALFALLGTTYGGDGQNTFAVPDLRSRVVVGAQAGAAGPGLSSYPLGTMGGAENVTLNANQLPVHGHPYALPLAGSTAGNLSDNPVGHLPGTTGTNNTYTTAAASGKNLANNAVANSTISAAGGSQPHSNIQPVLALNFIIATEGIYPPQP
ncbi:phage tail protein [Hymenobacter ruber]